MCLRQRINAVLASPSCVLVMCLVPLLLPWGSTASDVLLYDSYAERLLQGGRPYVDVAMEYPPLAVLVFCLPRLLVPAGKPYIVCFLLAMGGVEMGWKFWLWRQLPRGSARTMFLLTCTLAGAALYYTYLKRFDMVAAAASVAMCGLSVRRPAGLAAWLWCGLAVCCKLYPLVLMPLLWAHGRARGVGWGRQAAQTAVALGTVAAVLGMAYIIAGDASLSWWRHHQMRGLHLASTYTALALMWQGLGSVVPVQVAYGSWQVAAPWAVRCAEASAGITLLALAATWALCGRACRHPAGVWRGASATVIALLLASKVFSPQYMIWLVPLLAMASVSGETGQEDGWLAAGLVLACLLTSQTYPNEYRIATGQVSKQLALLMRDGVLLALWTRLCVPAQMLVFVCRRVKLGPRRVSVHEFSAQENVSRQF